MSRLVSIQNSKDLVAGQTGLDLLTAVLVWGLVLLASPITDRPISQSLVFTVIAAAAFGWALLGRSVYRQAPGLSRTDEISAVFLSVVTSAAAVTLVASFTDWLLGATEIVVASLGLFIARIVVRGGAKLVSESDKTPRPTERVIVVGVGDEAQELVQVIRDHPELRLDLCGVVGNLAVAERYDIADDWIGPTNRLVEIMRRYQIDSAIITTTGFRGEKLKELSAELFEAGFDVHLTTGIGRLWEGRFEVKSLVHEPFITIQRNSPKRWQQRTKRALDILGASTALALASPLIAVAAIAIYLEDRGPVIYKSKRIGIDSEEFEMIKFRSMIIDAEKLKAKMEADNERAGPLFKVSKDPRITKVGRIIRETSIDELPQLLNVIRGDMSLVGPRPALPEENVQFDTELRKRTSVRPGITGLWQVEARSNAAFNAYRRLDLHYVENWNLWLDIKILMATAEQVLLSLALIPVRKVFSGDTEATDAITTTEAEAASLEPFTVEEVIDLTDKSEAATKNEQEASS